MCHPEVGLLPQQAQPVCPTYPVQYSTTAPSPVSSAWELTPFTEPGWHTVRHFLLQEVYRSLECMRKVMREM